MSLAPKENSNVSGTEFGWFGIKDGSEKGIEGRKSWRTHQTGVRPTTKTFAKSQTRSVDGSHAVDVASVSHSGLKPRCIRTIARVRGANGRHIRSGIEALHRKAIERWRTGRERARAVVREKKTPRKRWSEPLGRRKYFLTHNSGGPDGIRVTSVMRPFHLAGGSKKERESAEKLLAVPRYRDLLDDQHDEDESEHGRALVSSKISWRTELAKWKTDAQAAEAAELKAAKRGDVDDSDADDDSDEVTESQPKAKKWVKTSLAIIFGGAIKNRSLKFHKRISIARQNRWKLWQRQRRMLLMQHCHCVHRCHA
ncbi:hypothetical protein B0H10DRAFT_1958675 [Mycena sp. CBHHK59/15]|nr:hypothetical protein B0H10DRAFT_1958675 [Mycena sp. CBHHK59/15]